MTSVGIPYLHCLISRARSDVLAIRRPCYAAYIAGMPLVGEQKAPTGGIPHLHGLIIRARGNALAIRRPCYTVNSLVMSRIGIRKAFWGKKSTKNINEETSSGHSC